MLSLIEGRWKLLIIFHLFARGMLRFSELERSIAGLSQKMLIQQLRKLERHGIVARRVHAQVPPKVEYWLTDLGQAMCPALDALLEWGAVRPAGRRQSIGIDRRACNELGLNAAKISVWRQSYLRSQASQELTSMVIVKGEFGTSGGRRGGHVAVVGFADPEMRGRHCACKLGNAYRRQNHV